MPRTREEIEESLKEIVVPAGRDDLRINIELLLDIRDLLEELVLPLRERKRIEQARLAREKVEEDRRRTVEEMQEKKEGENAD